MLAHNKGIAELVLGTPSPHIDHNGIDAGGCEAIVEGLLKNSTVHRCEMCTCCKSVASNGIKDEGCRFVGMLVEKAANLEVISVGGNGITDEGVKVIAKALKGNSTLKRLHMCIAKRKAIGGNSIGDEGIIELGDALSGNNSLEELTLCMCFADD